MKWEQMTCPECGEPVSATHEVLDGEALLQKDGKGGYQYAGTTNVFWDNQHTDQIGGADCLLCDNNHEWASVRIDD